jgi:hypothetical protein
MMSTMAGHNNRHIRRTIDSDNHNVFNKHNMPLFMAHAVAAVALFLLAGVLNDANEILEDDLLLSSFFQGDRLIRIFNEPDHPLLQAFFTVSVRTADAEGR